MGFEQLPAPIQQHIGGIARELGKNEDQGFLEELGNIWQRKATLFQEQARAVGMSMVEELPEGDPRGALFLTYSGSLLSVGPIFEGFDGRWMEYSSIKLRTDVPDIMVERDANIAGSTAVGRGVKLLGSKLKQTSSIYFIAVCGDEVPTEEQDKRIRESTIFLTNGFMKYNRTLTLDKSTAPDQFTMKSMTRYIAKKHNMTGVEAKQLIDDFLTLIETGMLLGETVPLGKIGKLSIKTRNAQKARVVKHPTSGEEITIEAKPAMGVPKISFSTTIKHRATEIKEATEEDVEE
jgi:nucleoid DNA-binding protein